MILCLFVYVMFFSTLVLIVSNFIVGCAFVTCYYNHAYLLTCLLTVLRRFQKETSDPTIQGACPHGKANFDRKFPVTE